MALTILSATVPTGGNYIEITFASDQEGAAPVSPETGITGLSFTVNGQGVGIYASGYAEGTHPMVIRFLLASVVFAGQAVTLSTSDTNITDALSEILEDVTDYPAVNDSLVLPPPTLSGITVTDAATVCRDGQGNPVSGIMLSFILKAGPGGLGSEYSTTEFEAGPSGDDGEITVQLVCGAKYLGKAANGEYVQFLASAAQTSQLPEMLGVVGVDQDS